MIGTLPRANNSAREGFTIIEILIAFTLVAILAVTVGPAFYRTLAGGQKKATVSSLQGVNNAIKQYYMDTLEYPNKLRDLVKKPADVSDWEGPYLDKEPRDAWKKPFVYKLTPEGAHPYELYSYGSDKGRATPKDKWISVWNL